MSTVPRGPVVGRVPEIADPYVDAVKLLDFKANVEVEVESKWEGKHRAFVDLVEEAVNSGKLRPFEAISFAKHFGVVLPSWVQEKHDHYCRHTKVGE